VIAMRELQRLHRDCVAFRRREHARRAGAALVLASLLALFLSQPFHASAPFGAPQPGLPTAAVSVASSALISQAAHDADLCSMCRATAQTRLGLRLALRLGEIAADRPCLALHLPAPVPAKAAPQLRQAQPRAPPASLPLLQA
jgi:hypothetical protein